MLSKEEVKEYATSLGYELHSRAADYSSMSFVKEFDNCAYCLHMTIDLKRRNMRLEAFPGLFTLSSGEFSYAHPKFEKFFEDKMSKMMQALVFDNLN